MKFKLLQQKVIRKDKKMKSFREILNVFKKIPSEYEIYCCYKKPVLWKNTWNFKNAFRKQTQRSKIKWKNTVCSNFQILFTQGTHLLSRNVYFWLFTHQWKLWRWIFIGSFAKNSSKSTKLTRHIKLLIITWWNVYQKTNPLWSSKFQAHRACRLWEHSIIIV